MKGGEREMKGKSKFIGLCICVCVMLSFTTAFAAEVIKPRPMPLPKDPRPPVIDLKGGNCPQLIFVTTSLPAGTVSLDYKVQLETSGGKPPLKFDIDSGTLPKGLELSKSGLILGKPETAGTFSFLVKVTDTCPQIVYSKQLSLTVNPAALPLSPPPANLPNLKVIIEDQRTEDNYAWSCGKAKRFFYTIAIINESSTMKSPMPKVEFTYSRVSAGKIPTKQSSVGPAGAEAFIPPGGKVTVSETFQGFSDEDRIIIEIKIDPSNEIKESNENDNYIKIDKICSSQGGGSIL
jgi:hypothetical protein